MHPFRQVRSGSIIRRTFDAGVDGSDLVWHRDKLDRTVTVVESNGWKLQYDGRLPIVLVEGSTYTIPAKSWHRVIKGMGPLKVIINEDTGMKITESQLRRVIREEILREAAQQKDIDKKGPILVDALYGMKSAPKTKKFKDMAAYEKWADSEDAENYTVQRVYSEGLEEADAKDEAESHKYGKKVYKASSGSVAAIKKHGGSAGKAVKAGAFDWADNPMAAAQAAHIVAMGEPTVAKGTKKKK